MKLEVRHTTTYRYDQPVTNSINEIRLTPRTNRSQSCHHHRLLVYPNVSMFSFEDYFGNRVHAFTVHQPHAELTIESSFTISKRDKLTPDWEPAGTLEEEWKQLEDASYTHKYAEYLIPTARTPVTDKLLAFIEQSVKPMLPLSVHTFVLRLANLIKTGFTYDPDATHVHTMLDEVLDLRGGVCQDFTHLMIAICRYYGIPARYISGYHFVGDLNTEMTDFQHASHAWVEVNVPGRGWFGIDPTNDTEANWRYIKLAHGRDYNDIVPVKGVYSGTPCNWMDVHVDVRLMDDLE